MKILKIVASIFIAFFGLQLGIIPLNARDNAIVIGIALVLLVYILSILWIWGIIKCKLK